MSQTTKKKHVTNEVLHSYALPEGDQRIVKVTAGRGNNLHEIVDADGDKYLVSMPTKFRKSVWIKRGDFVIVTPIEEGDKVKAEITHILLKHQIKYIQDEGKWPEAFKETVNNVANYEKDDQLFRNTNRDVGVVEESSDDTDSDDDSETDSESDSALGSETLR